MSLQVSIVLTIYGDDGDLFSILNCINDQTRAPDEVIIINSAPEEKIQSVIQKFKNLKIKYFYSNRRLLPGGARNLGVKKSIYPLIAFLDSKTLPEKSWLEISTKQMIHPYQFFIFGSTKYIAKTEVQRIILLSVFGKKPVSTIPGMVIHRKTFDEIGGFISTIRAAEDLEWRDRVNRHAVIQGITPKNYNLRYESISNSIFKEFYRSARNNWAAAKIDAQMHTRALIFCLTCCILLMLTPNWNRLIGGPLFVPNISKIYFIMFTLSFMAVYIINPQNLKILTKNIFLPLLFFLVLASFFIPELALKLGSQPIFIDLDQLFLSMLLVIGFIFRAFIAPLRLGAKWNDLVPIRWIAMGFFGVFNDMSKVPGYLAGACMSIGRMLKKN